MESRIFELSDQELKGLYIRLDRQDLKNDKNIKFIKDIIMSELLKRKDKRCKNYRQEFQ